MEVDSENITSNNLHELCNKWNRELQKLESMEEEQQHPIKPAHQLDMGEGEGQITLDDEATLVTSTLQDRGHQDKGQDKGQDNMEKVREEVREFFKKCREMLDQREQTLLDQITEERKVVQPQLITKKKRVLKNHAIQRKLHPLVSIDEGSGSDDNGHKTCNKEEEKQTGCHNCNATDALSNAKDTLQRRRGRKLKSGSVKRRSENGFHHSDGLSELHLSRADKKEMKHFENIVQNIGLIYMGNADPSKTIAVARPALVCAKCTAKVKAIDNRGKECKTGGDSFVATMHTPDDSTVPCDIIDNENGTYAISFRPKVPGTHQLHVSVSGQPIKSSPLQVRVQPVRLQARSSFVGGPCMFGLDIANKYRVPFGDKRDETEAEQQKLTPDMMGIAVRDQEGELVESSVIGCVCNNKEVSTFNVRFLPKIPGDYDIQVSLKPSGRVIAQQVIPVHEREQIGGQGSRMGEFLSPTDVAVSPQGDIFVADTVENSRIQRFTMDGTYIDQFRVPFQEPAYISADAHHVGAVYLNSKQVAIYTYDGHLIHQFGNEQLTQPNGIALNSNGSIYVIDLALQCLLIFNKSGKLGTRLGQEGTRPGEFNHPHFVAIGSDDHIFVSEARNFRIQELLPVGTYNKELRSKDKLGLPGSIAVTTGGHLLVHDEKSQLIQIINLDENRFAGNLPLELMQPNTGRIAVTQDGYVIVLDMYNHCLWRYRIPYSS